jgi:hypothetical protein
MEVTIERLAVDAAALSDRQPADLDFAQLTGRDARRCRVQKLGSACRSA